MNNSMEQLEKFKELVNDIRICMLITKGTDGKLAARPMGNAKVEDDGSIWFFTNEYSGKVTEISHENEVYLTYSSPSKNSYVAFSGKATLSEDKAKMKELWNDSMKAWFPEGLEDPNIMLIKVDPSEAEFWDGPSSKIVLAFQMLKGIVTGKQADVGEHGTLKV